MTGGTILQFVGNKVEVLDETYFDRRWRLLANPDEVEVGDKLWWMDHTGYATRDGVFRDKNIGRCTMADEPTKAEMENA